MAIANEQTLWWVYILRCADNTLYVGLAKHLAARIRQHNGLAPGGARYTRSRRPVALWLAAACATRSEAAQLEYAVKRLTRRQKERLSSAPDWVSGADALDREVTLAQQDAC